MISSDLKKIIDLSGGRYIIVEDGKPKYVVMKFEEYKTTSPDQKSILSLTEEELIDKINSDIAMWRENKENANEDLVSEIEKLEDIEYI